MDYEREIDAAASSARRKATLGSAIGSQEDIKDILLDIIAENPGIWYRELLRLTGSSNGALAHHLGVLEDSGRIKVQRQDHLGKTRYFSVSVLDSETNVISAAKSATARQIMLMMLEREFCTFGEIVGATGKSPSTISWHMKRLAASEVVATRYGELALYCLKDRDTVMDVLSKYGGSLLETIANNYAEIIDEL